MAFANPTVQEFKDYFARDFPFGTDPETSVIDSDIARAFVETNSTINQSLFCAQADYTSAYMLLAAHNLCMNLRAAEQGVNGKFGFLETSKSVGSVSQGFSVPDRFMSNPLFMMYAQTTYGMRYLMTIYPALTGAIASVRGRTHA